jgi:predicted PurR-regulated permease PerM
MEGKLTVRKWLYAFSIILLAIIFANLGATTSFINTIISALMPFIIGVIIAYVLYLPERKIEKRLGKCKKDGFVNKHKRTLAIIIVYVVVGIVLYAFINIISPIISNSVGEFVKNVPDYYKTIEESEVLDNEIGEYILDQLNKVDLVSIFDFDTVIKYVKSTIGIAKEVFNIFVSIIVSIYLLAGRKEILAFWNKQAKANLSKERYLKVCKYTKEVNTVLANYLSGQILDSILVGILATIVLSILHVKYAVLLGIIIGFSNLIPFFGAIFGIGFALIIIALTGGIKVLLIAGISILVLQQLDANIINPKITSTQVDVSPLLTIVSITIGGAIFSVLGMFLAVPVVAIIKMIMEDVANDKLKEKA